MPLCRCLPSRSRKCGNSELKGVTPGGDVRQGGSDTLQTDEADLTWEVSDEQPLGLVVPDFVPHASSLYTIGRRNNIPLSPALSEISLCQSAQKLMPTRMLKELPDFDWESDIVPWPAQWTRPQLPQGFATFDGRSQVAAAAADLAAELGPEAAETLRRALALNDQCLSPLAAQELRRLQEALPTSDALRAVPGVLAMAARMDFISRISGALTVPEPVPPQLQEFNLGHRTLFMSMNLEKGVARVYFRWEIAGSLEQHAAIQLEPEIERMVLAADSSVSVECKVHDMGEFFPSASVRQMHIRRGIFSIENVPYVEVVDAFEERPKLMPPGLLRCTATAPDWMLEALGIPLRAERGIRVVNRGNCQHFEPIAPDRVRVRMSVVFDVSMVPSFLIPLSCLQKFVLKQADSMMAKCEGVIAEWEKLGCAKIMEARKDFYERLRERAAAYLLKKSEGV
mmetsp:Transcript_87757/g.246598  ORF Transcript_87757/g.246598 Transcript_87757/m.246598 type:complete len:454 (-) Transcript_87757:104-1465(-)|eukprot:CAMPEP_0117492504 /NCGR_PEP_ID=MMETSP0784-20121206/18615_1 /TAXON_ID=39447 /ORGANISM="" /LENGTH=453 /DNA_ID=CAMNT_0005287325 /DNA_START=79 /DNA_END=1440 /DNA_ORIENTATION=+